MFIKQRNETIKCDSCSSMKNTLKIIKFYKNLYVINYLNLIILILTLTSVNAQWTTRDPRFYSREGVFDYFPPNPGDPNYRTYTYNDRRYGVYQPGGFGQQYPGQLNPGQYPSGIPQGEDRFKYDPNNPQSTQTPFPGILGGWRDDIQGKQRRDSLQLERDVFVTTNYGQIQGFKVHMYDNPDPTSFYRPWLNTIDRITGECSVFLGIPYALPPTIEGRFKPPRPHRGWQLLQAVDFGPACPQPIRYVGATKGIRDMHEDCLYLNIYSPTTKSGVAQKFPVMFYIHGGDFIYGASNTFPAHILATFYNVVVVTFNYRLGALGFLSTGDENSPGNYGILDQSLALRWVHDNIEFFNGDRNSITVFGPDAGAASAGLLAVAPLTRDMVTRVIAMSGSATADWALISDKYRVQNTSQVFGQLLGCSTESSWKLVNCLRTGRSAQELGNSEFTPQVGMLPWAPVVDINITFPGDDWYENWRERDWHFLKETPEELIKKRQFNRGLHYMSGVTTQEAAFLISQNESLSPYYDVDTKFFEQKIKEFVLRYNYTLNPDGVYEAIKYMYTYWPDPGNQTLIRDQFINLFSDFLYRAPNDQIIKLLVAENVPTYTYVLNTTVESLNLPEWRKYPHNAEYYFITGAPFMDTELFPKRARLERAQWTDNDRNMSHFFMKTFSDFARFGNPTPQQVLGLHYEMAKNGDLRYLNLNTTYNTSILMNYRQTECAFWTQYLPTVIGVLVPTYPPSTEFWWEPSEPLQIAFWSMSAACLFLIVLVVICCILWRNAKRQSDRFYDGDIFMNDVQESERDLGIENNVTAVHPIRSRENLYEYRDAPAGKMTKLPPETASLRSPSSIAVTQTTKSGSQSSLRSAMSAKEKEAISPTPSSITKGTNFDKNFKVNERYVETGAPPRKNGGKYDDSKNLLGNYEKRSRDNLALEHNSPPSYPVPATRKTNLKASRTQLVEGIPQTEV